jgi:hypothetical protein
MLNNPTEQVDVVQRFQESEMRMFDYTRAFDVSEIVGDYLAESDADAVANLTINVKSTVGTFFVNMFTLGLAYAVVFEVEGDLINFVGDTDWLDGYSVLSSGTTVGEALDISGSETQITDALLMATEDGYQLLVRR